MRASVRAETHAGSGEPSAGTQVIYVYAFCDHMVHEKFRPVDGEDAWRGELLVTSSSPIVVATGQTNLMLGLFIIPVAARPH